MANYFLPFDGHDIADQSICEIEQGGCGFPNGMDPRDPVPP